MSDQSNENKGENPIVAESNESETAGTEHKRLAARRRFMRMGAGGSAGLLVTVMHKRAFAGAKKTPSAQSLCGSTATPDFTKANNKKALQQSAMGTPKGLVCVRTGTPDSCAYGTTPTNFYAPAGSPPPGSPNNAFGIPTRPPFVAPANFDEGCGKLQDTLNASFNYRLYEKGWCPIIYDPASRTMSYGSPTVYKYVTRSGTSPNFTYTSNDCQL